MSKCLGDIARVKTRRTFVRPGQALASNHPFRQATAKADRHGLALRYALQVKQAEYWLQLGEPIQAMDQLKSLPTSGARNCWAVKVQVAAIHAAREQGILS